MIRPWLKALKDRFHALQIRERLLLIIALGAAVWGVPQPFYFDPVAKEQKQLQADISQLKQDISALEARKIVLDAEIRQGSLEVLRAQMDELKRRRDGLDQALLSQGIKLLDPERMREVLHDVLKGSRLKLHALRRLPVEVAYTTETVKPQTEQTQGAVDKGEHKKTKPSPSAAQPLTLYRHSLQIELDGTYADMLDYLDRLEQSGWQFMWHALDIETLDYPVARLRLTVSTLSLRKEWIGV